MRAEGHRNWSSAGFLGKAVEAYNNEYHKSTRFTPFQALRYRRNTILDARLAAAANIPEAIIDKTFLLDPQEVHATVAANQEITANRMVDRSLRTIGTEFQPYKEGQRVYVARRNWSKSKAFQMAATVVKKVAASTYEIRWITHGNNVSDKPGTIARYRHRYMCLSECQLTHSVQRVKAHSRRCYGRRASYVF